MKYKPIIGIYMAKSGSVILYPYILSSLDSITLAPKVSILSENSSLLELNYS